MPSARRRILADRGINHVIIVEEDLLAGDLSRYDLIYLPYMPLLSAEKQQALIAYAEQGGTLVLLGQCGIKDQYNLLNDKIILANALGADTYSGKKTADTLGRGRIIYLPLSIPDSKFLIPAKMGENATTFGPSMNDVFADIPEGYTRNRIDPELRGHLNKAADEITNLLDGRMTYIVKGTPFLEMTTMTNKRKDLILVHLVNYDVLLDGTVTPAEKVKLKLLIPEGKKVKNLTYGGELRNMKAIKFVESDRIIEFEVPAVNIYGLALVEL